MMTVLWFIASLIWVVAYFWRTWLWLDQKDQIEFLQDALDSSVTVIDDLKFDRDGWIENFKTQERLYAELKEKYKLLDAVRVAALAARGL